MGARGPVRDLEDLPLVRALVGVGLAVLVADALALASDATPGGRLAAVCLLALPIAAGASWLVPPGWRGRVAGAVGPAAVGGVVAGLLAALWAGRDAGTARAYPWIAGREPNAFDLLWRGLSEGELGPFLGACGVAAVVAAPLAWARRRALGLPWVGATGAAAGLLAAGPLAAGAGGAHAALLAIGGLLAGAGVGLGSWLMGPPAERPADPPRPGVAAGGALTGAVVWAGLLQVGVAPDLPPPPPDPRPALEAAAAALERYRAEQGRFPTTLGHLPDADPELARGLLEGYLVRYATFDGRATWRLTADPHPPYPGLSAYRLGPRGLEEVRLGAPLEPE